MITAAQPAVLSAPMPFEANAGVFSGRAPRGTTMIRVLVDGRPLRRVVLSPGQVRSSFGPTGLPPNDVTIQVRFMRGTALIGRRVVTPVFGLPAASWRVVRPRRTDAAAQKALAAGRPAPGVSSAVWSAGLTPGSAAASRNAGAIFTGASTLKLAILICTFARDESEPVTSGLFSTYQEMILDSSNAAADAVLDHVGGSTSGGGASVESCVRQLGVTNTIMYGGYTIDSVAPPVDTDDAALVFTPKGTLVDVIMTEASGDISYASSRAYGARVTHLALKRLLPR